MKRGIPVIRLLGFIAIAGLGCSSHVAKLTLFSTKNVDLSQPHDRIDRVEETDHRFWLLFLPLGGAPSGLRAATQIQDDEDADYLTNVEVTEGGWTLLAISHGWVTVEADAWRQRSGKPSTK